MPKEISLIPTTHYLETKGTTVNPTVVIFDILRATSTITTALAHGANAIIPVLEPIDAQRLYATLVNQTLPVLFGGERNGEPIAGFHLGNSPLEYTKEKVCHQTIIFTTTNGTRAMINSQKAGAQKILIGSLLNQRVIVRSIEQDPAITIICAGVRGQFAFEDFYAAGLMLNELLSFDQDYILDDYALAALGLGQRFQNNPAIIAYSDHGRRLQNNNKAADVQFCAAANRFSVLPVFIEDRILLTPTNY